MAATPGTLTPTQAARRQRVIDAALQLGAAGGYDAVQMRTVADTAEVALGTIYRYFSSKDHLLAAALVDWVDELERRVNARPPKGPTAADRMVTTLRRANRAMEREPRLAEAVVTAIASPDPGAAGLQQDVAAAMNRILSRTIPEEVDADRRSEITRTLGHVWFSSLIGWVNGWSGIDRVGDELEIAAHLILDPYS